VEKGTDEAEGYPPGVEKGTDEAEGNRRGWRRGTRRGRRNRRVEKGHPTRQEEPVRWREVPDEGGGSVGVR
jgi:hypothetical protein